MKKIIISLVLSLVQIFNITSVPVSAQKVDSTVYLMLKESVCDQDTFVDRIDEVTEGEQLSDYGGSIEVEAESSTVLFGDEEILLDNGNTAALMYEDSLYVPVRAMEDVFDYEVSWDDEEKQAIIEHDEQTTAITTSHVAQDDEITGVIIDNKTYAPVEEVAELMGYSVATNSSGETAELTEKFQMKRLFVKLKDINNLSDKSLLEAFSDVTDVTTNEEGLIFAEFETEEETKIAYEKLSTLPCVNYVEPDRFFAVELNAYPYTWGIESCNFTNFIKVNPQITQGGGVATVAIIDSGINVADPIFNGKVIYREGCMSDENGHGTHVAGIVAATTQLAGSNVKIIPFKLNVSSTGEIDLVSLSNMYIQVNLASSYDVINMSLGISPLSEFPTLKDAISSVDNSVLVVAAGNDNQAVIADSLAGAVAGKANGIVVTAADWNNIPASFSNYAYERYFSYIAAPGVDVFSTYYVNGIPYIGMNGTSMASPHVAAACALISLANNNPNPGQIKTTLLQNHCYTPSGWNNAYGVGVLRMSNLVTGVLNNGFSWKYEGNDLTISGNGQFPSIGSGEEFPWSYYANDIKKVIFDGDIHSIPFEKFKTMPKLESIAVSDNSSYYSVENGMVYSQNKMGLFCVLPNLALGEININDITEHISVGAFSGCENLTSVVLPKTLRFIFNDAFADCVNLSDIYYEGTSDQWEIIEKGSNWDKNAGIGTYAGKYNITYNYISPDYSGKCGETAVWKIWNGDSTLTIEGMGEMYDFTITGDGHSAGWAKYSDSLTNLNIKNGITVIGKMAFMSDSFVNVVLPDTITEIKDTAFSIFLENITLSKNFSVFNLNAFENSTYIKNIYVHEENEKFFSVNGALCTKEDKELLYLPYGKDGESILVSGGIKKIGKLAFYRYNKTKSITLPETVEEIGERAFDHSALEEIHLPQSLKKIGKEAFLHCLFETVTVPSGVEYIGDGAFKNCGYVDRIFLPDTIKEIGSGVFAYSSLITIYYAGTEEQWNNIKKPTTWNENAKNVTVQYDVGFSQEDYDDTGKCGTDSTWFFWEDSGTLLVESTGTIEYTETLYKNYRNKVKKIIISKGATEIGDGAFWNFTALESISIPNSVTKIGDQAFNGCDKLTTINLPNSVEEIGIYAFSGCGFKNITLPSSLKTVTYCMLSYCKELETVNISEGTTQIDACVFQECSALKEVNLPESLKVLGQYAFINCTALESITIPDGVTEIMSGTFENCSALETVNLSDGVLSILDDAFENCVSLKPFVLPKELEKISPVAFRGTAIDEFLVHPESTKITAVDGVLYSYDKKTLLLYPTLKEGTVFTVPQNVTKIGEKAFAYNKYLEKVVIPSGITEIPNYAFCEAENLKELVCGTIETIGEYAFNKCSKLENFSFDGIKTIGQYAFANCSSLKKLTIAEQIESIGAYAFSYCTGFEEVLIYKGDATVSSGVFNNAQATIVYYTGTYEQWRNSAFRGIRGTVVYNYNPETETCGGKYTETISWEIDDETGTLEITGYGQLPDLTSGMEAPWAYNMQSVKTVKIGEGITAIGNYTFSGRTGIENIILPTTLETIGDYAFSNCTSISEIALPANLKTIGDSVLKNCSHLTGISIPDSVETIGIEAFMGCKNLAVAELSSSADISDNTFKNCTNLTSVTLKGTIKSIGASAFEGCENLSDITLPENLDTIGDRAFYGCEVLEVGSLPDKVKTIGTEAFYNCAAMKSIIISDNIEKIGRDALSIGSEYITVYFKGTVEKWRTASASGFYNMNVCCYFNEAVYPEYFGIVSNTFWHIDVETKTLKYFGNGVISSANYYNKQYESYVENIEFSESVTNIPGGAFSEFSNVKSVTVPSHINAIGAGAFQGCTNLTEVNMENTEITVISGSVFSGATNLVKVTLPPNVQEIGNNAFKDCSKLPTISLPETVTKIGDYAFSGCSAMTEFKIPSAVTYIGKSAFSACKLLTEIELPANITTIEDSTFSSCKGLTEINVPSGVTSIGYEAFRNCTGLEKVTIPESVTSFGVRVFNDCENVKIYYEGTTAQWAAITNSDQISTSRVVFAYEPESGEIGGECGKGVFWSFDEETATLSFYGNGKVEDYDESNPTSIPWYGYADRITSVNIGEGIENIGENSFYGCDLIADITVDDKNSYLVAKDGVLYLLKPYTLLFYPATKTESEYSVLPGTTLISRGAFRNNANIKKVILPESLTVLDEYTFYNCSKLSSVYVPKSVTSIKQYCFGKSSLWCIYYSGSKEEWNNVTKEENWNNNSTKICYYSEDGNNLCTIFGTYTEDVFWQYFSDSKTLKIYTSGDMTRAQSVSAEFWTAYQSSIKNIEIYGTTTCIPDNFFSGYSSVENVVLPTTVKSIGNNAFKNCTALTQISVENGLETIGDNAFYGCAKLDFDLPESIETIGSYAFYNCAMLNSDLPDSCKNISDYTFYGCTSFNAELPKSLETIGEYAFYGCTSLDASMPENIEKIGEKAFSGCTCITKIELGASLSELGANAFDGCSGVTEITIKNNISSIGKEVFKGMTKLEKVEILADSFNVPKGMFMGCNALKTFEFSGEMELIGSYAFYGCSKLVDFRIPEEVKSIGEYAFYNCAALSEVEIPSGVTEIAKSSFENCSAITQITLPRSVTKISGRAFYGCSGLEKLIIPKNVTTIEEYFYYSSSQSKLVVLYEGSKEEYSEICEDTYSVIRYSIYYNYNFETGSFGGNCGTNVTWNLDVNTKTLEISGTGDMTSVPWSKFAGDIENVKIGDGVTEIYDYAFENCVNLKNVTFPKTNFEISSSAFYGCIALEEITLPSNVTYLESSAFYGCTALKKVIIYDGIGSISSGVFSGCTSLETIFYTGTYENIYSKLGQYKGMLVCGYNVEKGYSEGVIGENITWKFDPDGTILELVGEGDMAAGSYSGGPWGASDIIKKVNISDGITSIGNSIFRNMSALEEVNIPQSVLSIGSEAFGNCVNLAKINYNATEYSWSNITKSFYWDNNMGTNVSGGTVITYNSENGDDLPFWQYDSSTYTLKLSGNGALEDWTSSTLSSIPWKNYNSSIKNIYIGPGITHIGSYSFYELGNVETITVAPGNTAYHMENGAIIETASGKLILYPRKTKTAEYIVPDGVKTIGEGAFRGNGYIEKVILSNEVITIDCGAFENCGFLQYAYIPKALKTVNKNAFNNSLLFYVYYEGTQQDWNNISMDFGEFELKDSQKCFNSDKNNLCTAFGSYGEMTWQYFDNDKLLVIYTNGTDTDFSGNASWKNYAASIETAQIIGQTTKIGNTFFYNCTALKNIIMPEGIKTIGNYAFYGCTALEEFEIPDTVTTIGDNAFLGCSALEGINIPEGVTSIGSGAFKNCVNLAVINYGRTQQLWDILTKGTDWNYLMGSEVDGGTVIKCVENSEEDESMNWSFDAESGTLTLNGTGNMNDFTKETYISCPWNVIATNVTSVHVGANLTHIGEYALYGLYNVSEITVAPENGAYYAEGGVLYRKDSKELVICPPSTKTTQFVVPDGVQKIGSGAFTNCKSIKSVYIHSSVKAIEQMIFDGCSSLSAIYYEGTREQWQSMTYENNLGTNIQVCYNADADNLCTDYGTIQNVFWQYFANSKTLNIDTTGDLPDVSLGTEGWRKYKTTVQNVIISGTATRIGRNNFYDFTVLKSITMPESVKRIGGNAFRNCTRLASLFISADFETLDQTAFSGCTGLKNIYYEGSKEQWKTLAGTLSTSATVCYYADKNNLCTAYGDYDNNTFWQYFSNNKELKIYTSGDMTELGKGNIPWDDYSYNAEKVTIYGLTTHIAAYSFDSFRNLQSITIPDGVKTIGDYAFNYCSKLANIDLPDGVNSIGKGAFKYCSVLEFNKLPQGLTEYSDELFYGCNAIKEVIVPLNITKIGDDVFASCRGLEKVVLHKGITEIGNYAFWACSNIKMIGFLGSMSECKFDSGTSCENKILYNYDPATNLSVNSLGNNITAVFNPENGALELTGTGNMIDISSFTEKTCIPKDLVKKVIIADGITSVGKFAFYNCRYIKYVVIPKTVTAINLHAFSYCQNLETIYYCGTEAEWENITKASGWNNQIGQNLESGTAFVYNYDESTSEKTLEINVLEDKAEVVATSSTGIYNGSFIIAVFRGGKLINFVKTPAVEKYSFSGFGDADLIKVMWFENFKELKPACKIAEYTR